MKRICLYDYQREMMARISSALYERCGSYVHLGKGAKVLTGRSVMVQMPTGTGKTYLMAAVVKEFMRNRKGDVWIIAHRHELVEQIVGAIGRFGMECSDGKDMETEARIRVMSIQWLSRHVDVKASPKLIIIDEAHHALADTYQELWSRYPYAMKLGLTATPCRMQKKGFTNLFDELLMSWSINEFIRKGYLSLYDYVVNGKDSEEQIAIDSLEKHGADGDYSIAEMDSKLNVIPSISRLYYSMEKYAHGKKGIVYAIDIRHAKKIAQYYTARNVKAVAVDSKTPSEKRRQAVENFRRGKIGCIVNVNLFDEGFDCPDVEFIQMARPTLSLSKYMQMIGRGLRVHPDKKTCVIIDNAGLYRMFGRPDEDRKWQEMFEVKIAGKGGRRRKIRNEVRIVNNEMEVVARHSQFFRRLSGADDKYYEDVEPFERDGRWGLRRGEEIILHPVYRYISPFVGEFCTFELIPGYWGVLQRNGKQYIRAEFRAVELFPNGDAILTRNEISKRRVHLRTTFKARKDLAEWWGEYYINIIR